MNSANHSCAIFACTPPIRAKSNEAISWHSIPCMKYIHAREQWINIIKQSRNNDNWQPKKSAKICSRHFEKRFFMAGKNRRTLSHDAIPSLFLHIGLPRNINLNMVDYEENEYPNEVGELMLYMDNIAVDDPPLEVPYRLHLDIQTREMNQLIQALGLATLGVLLLHKTGTIKEASKFSRKRKLNDVLESPKSKLKKVTKIYHKYCSIETPRTKCGRLEQVAQKFKRELILLKQTLKRREFKQKYLMKTLRNRKLLTPQQLEVCNSYSHVVKMLIEAQLKKNTVEYTGDMKQFAATLHFYSPKAYLFLRQHLKLPHPSTIISWMKSANCDPGICLEVVENLKKEREKDPQNYMTDIVMIIDEMSIRKDTPWDQRKQKYLGYCDDGSGTVEDDCSLASNALVCLVAGLSGGWKCPIGYIFTDKCDGQKLCTFVKNALNVMTDSGFVVHTLTADGGTSNVAMFSHFGVKENVKSSDLKVLEDNITPYFINEKNNRKVFDIYDVVHMLKLWRNLWKHFKEISWKHGEIKWNFIEELNKVQQSELIVAGKKINENHINFEQHKMKVKYATQVFSTSVADAIDFCCEDLGLQQFKDSKSTTMFIRRLDRAFDILNSRNPKQTGFKAPMTSKTLSDNIAFLNQVVTDILEISCEIKVKRKGVYFYKRELLCKSRRKRAAIGLAISIKSIISVSEELLYRNELPFRYVLTYRFSQDLLELFFNKVRSKLGKNDNPNVIEFTNIMKWVWHQNLLKSTSTGNCLNQDEDIPKGLLKLQCPTRKKNTANPPVEDILIPEYCNVETEFYENCLAYISGNVVHAVADDIKCSTCFDSLFDNNSDSLPVYYKNLIARKSNGGLKFPSYSVYKLCKKADGYFKSMTNNLTIIPKLVNLDSIILGNVMKDAVGLQLFPNLGNHIMDFDPAHHESHLTIVIRLVVKHFLKIRLYSHGKRFRRHVMGISQRHSLTKTTLFRNE